MSGFGIVGTGVIAAMHAATIATLPGARLTAVTDVAADAATAFAAARGCAAAEGGKGRLSVRDPCSRQTASGGEPVFAR